MDQNNNTPTDEQKPTEESDDLFKILWVLASVTYAVFTLPISATDISIVELLAILFRAAFVGAFSFGIGTIVTGGGKSKFKVAFAIVVFLIFPTIYSAMNP